MSKADDFCCDWRIKGLRVTLYIYVIRALPYIYWGGHNLYQAKLAIIDIGVHGSRKLCQRGFNSDNIFFK